MSIRPPVGLHRFLELLFFWELPPTPNASRACLLQGKGTGSGHRTLLYGNAILLRHQNSDMYLACLSTSSSNDKLSFDVGLQEHSQGEACWWTVHPASKQRSEGEKVRVGDDLILVSVATERYLVRRGEDDGQL
ncbi:hypothetical protein FOCC_FOCC007063, partial [Frankliniella occidentalis]